MSIIKVGHIVEHCMGHRGEVVAVDGPHAIRVCVRFRNTTSWVFASDVKVVG